MKKNIKLKRLFGFWGIAICLAGFISGCTYYIKEPPPPVRVEVRPARPYSRAVWIPGRWKWRGRRRRGRYIWIPGHWRRR